jgi:multidrug resistance efflux pump
MTGSDYEAKEAAETTTGEAGVAATAPPAATAVGPRPSRLRSLARYAVTLSVAAIAAFCFWQMWQLYMGTPWTRDGKVRAYVVTMAPEIYGRIVELPVRDNQFVKKGELLMVIEPTNYEIAVKFARAAVEEAEAVAINAKADSERRNRLMDQAVSTEERQTYRARWLSAQASYQKAVAHLELARANLERTRIYSPVNGYVTNLLAQLGDYAHIGDNLISVVNSDSFWVDGYFEETNIDGIAVGDPAYVKLMGYSTVVRGHVDSIASGINVPNAQPNGEGLAKVNPIFTWVRLAQRIPVRIHIDEVPAGVVLAAGMTATVEIKPRARAPAPQPASQPASTATSMSSSEPAR